MDTNSANCDTNSNPDQLLPQNIDACQERNQLQIRNTNSVTSVEIATHSLETTSQEVQPPEKFCVGSLTNSEVDEKSKNKLPAKFSMPLLLIGASPSVVIPATGTCGFVIKSSIPSQHPLLSLNSARLSQVRNGPQPLFNLALSKLTNNESLTMSVLRNMMAKSQYSSFGRNVQQNNAGPRTGELSPPNSLISAPPSYSYVLRQMSARRRPRFMGTFIPSPSFIPHLPPPNYNAGFDIYVNNTVPPPPRLRQLGFAPVPVVCPECGYTGMSVAISKITMCTHMCAIVLCLFFCWVCAPLPYMLSSCKDVYHYCGNCRYFLGMYCPTNTTANMS